MSISVAMTTFNGGKRVIKQLYSITHQTLNPDEIIVCDDKSTDNTIELVKDFAKDYPEVKWTIVVNDYNLGYKRNFAKAISLSNSKVTFLSDQDDYWFSNKIEKMYSVMEMNSEIKVLACDYEKIDEEAFLKNNPIETDIKNWKEDIHSYYNSHVHKICFTEFFYMTHFPGCCFAISNEFSCWFQSRYWDGNEPHDEFLLIVSQLLDSAFSLDEKLIFYLRHNDAVTYKKMSNREQRLKLLIDKKKTVSMALDFLDNESGIDGVIPKKTMIKNQLEIINRRIDYLGKPSIGRALILLTNLCRYEKVSYFLGDIILSLKNRS